jgi:hypothetical protein
MCATNSMSSPSQPRRISTRRAFMLRRLFRFYFQQDMPHAPYLIQRS